MWYRVNKLNKRTQESFLKKCYITNFIHLINTGISQSIVQKTQFIITIFSSNIQWQIWAQLKLNVASFPISKTNTIECASQNQSVCTDTHWLRRCWQELFRLDPFWQVVSFFRFKVEYSVTVLLLFKSSQSKCDSEIAPVFCDSTPLQILTHKGKNNLLTFKHICTVQNHLTCTIGQNYTWKQQMFNPEKSGPRCGTVKPHDNISSVWTELFWYIVQRFLPRTDTSS